MNVLRLGGALLLAGASLMGHSPSQDPPVTQDPLRQQIQRLQQELEALRNQRNIDQILIQQLEERLAGLERAMAEAPPDAPQQAQVPPVQQQQQTQDPMLMAMPQNNLLNPAITVFTDIMGTLTDDSDDNRYNRFSVREIEVDFRAPITHQVNGVLIMALAEEIEQETDGTIEVERLVEVEEGYIDFHTLPWEFSSKAGRFRNEFGRNNRLHVHDLPQVDRPLAVQAFLSPEGLITDGISVEHLIPNPWDTYVNGFVQVVNSDAGETPILGDANTSNPAVLGRLSIFQDTSATSFIDIGGTYLWGRADSNDATSSTFGVDFTFTWQDPAMADFHSFLVQSELFWTDLDDFDDGMGGTFDQDSFGWYAFAQYQLGLNWYAGVRYDWTEYPNNEVRGPNDHDWAVSPYLTWYLSEFIRLRFEYQHLETDMGGVDGEEEIFFLNLTAVFGSHPAHPYWVNR